MKEQLFEMENNGFSGVRWKRTTKTKKTFIFFKKKVTTGVQAETAKLTEGLCFGYSTIWVTKMLDGVNAEDATPDELRAGLLQQKVEMWQKKGGWDNAVAKAVEDLGCKVKQKQEIPWKQTADRLGFQKGLFLVDIGIHWVAMGVTQSHFYFFDANEGLFRYDQQFEFRSDVNSGDNFGYYESHDWMTNPGKVCNCYEIVSN